MIIGSLQRLKSVGKFSLQICDEFLDKTDCYKYLGVIINETLSWGDHVDYISTKVNQRLGILRRIRHLLPTPNINLQGINRSGITREAITDSDIFYQILMQW